MGKKSKGEGKRPKDRPARALRHFLLFRQGRGWNFLGLRPPRIRWGRGYRLGKESAPELLAVLSTPRFRNLGSQSQLLGPERSRSNFVSHRGGFCRKRERIATQILTKSAEGESRFGRVDGVDLEL